MIRTVQLYAPYDFEFAYNNKNISVRVTDKNFIDGIEKGKVSFTKGDTIIANLKVTEYKSGKKLYEVIKVIRYNTRIGEPKFDFNE